MTQEREAFYKWWDNLSPVPNHTDLIWLAYRQGQIDKEAELAAKGEAVDMIELMKEAQEIVESKSLWEKFIDGTPLSNDIAVWMAEFAYEHASPQAAPVPEAQMILTKGEVK